MFIFYYVLHSSPSKRPSGSNWKITTLSKALGVWFLKPQAPRPLPLPSSPYSLVLYTCLNHCLYLLVLPPPPPGSFCLGFTAGPSSWAPQYGVSYRL